MSEKNKGKNAATAANKNQPAKGATGATKTLDEVTGAMPPLSTGVAPPAAAAASGGTEGEELDDPGEGAEGAAEGDGKKPRKSRKAMNIIKDPETKDAEGNPLPFKLLGSDAQTCRRYASLFLTANIQFSGGYKKFITNDGFSNDTFPKEMALEGHLKVCVVSLAILGDRAGKGDDEAGSALKILGELAKTAAHDAQGAAQAEQLVALANSGMDVSALILQLAPNVQTIINQRIADKKAKSGKKNVPAAAAK